MSDPVDMQDPLPETNWLWRRVFTFVLTIASATAIWYWTEEIIRLRQPAYLFSLIRYAYGVHVMLILFYMVAPSAEQIVKLIQAARIIREGIPSSGSASIQTSEGRTEVTTSSGVPASAPAPDEEDAAPRGAA
jgi:hypothetical protein